MAYQPHDYYARKAKAEHYAARSVYKLKEINERFRILKKGQQVMDLGAAPGSWSQYISSIIGNSGRLLGIDQKPVQVKLPNAVFITADLHQSDLDSLIKQCGLDGRFDVVLSDMAPSTTSSRFADQMCSLELARLALNLAVRYLKKGGSLVIKIFASEDAVLFRNEIAIHFEKVVSFRPRSTQKSSKEFFYIATGFKGS
jgi:23S rRNA (uridine2552-2'-O)-methyltransferase